MHDEHPEDAFAHPSQETPERAKHPSFTISRPKPADQTVRPRRTRFYGALVAVTLSLLTALLAAVYVGRPRPIILAMSLAVGRHVPLRPVSPPNLVAVAERVEPAVVDVTAELAFGQGMAAGTGIVLTPSGTILTNNHVIEDALQITVTEPMTHRSFAARVIGVEPKADLALLQAVGAKGLPTATLGTVQSLRVGDPVVAIGNAYGQGRPTIVQGKLLAFDRTITAGDATSGYERLTGLMETSTPLAPGDSGGPLLNSAGQVVGIDTAASLGGGYAGRSADVGFAIPIDSARTVIADILANRSGNGIYLGQPAFLGVEVADSSDALVPGAVPLNTGAVVLAVVPNSPAFFAGLQPGDVIVSFGERAVRSAPELRQLILSHRPGQAVRLQWIDLFGMEETAIVHLIAGPAI